MNVVRRTKLLAVFGVLAAGVLCAQGAGAAGPQQNAQPASGPDILRQEPTNTTEPRPTAEGKPLPNRDEVMRRQMAYLNARYDLTGKTDPTVLMSGGRKRLP